MALWHEKFVIHERLVDLVLIGDHELVRRTWESPNEKRYSCHPLGFKEQVSSFPPIKVNQRLNHLQFQSNQNTKIKTLRNFGLESTSKVKASLSKHPGKHPLHNQISMPQALFRKVRTYLDEDTEPVALGLAMLIHVEFGLGLASLVVVHYQPILVHQLSELLHCDVQGKPRHVDMCPLLRVKVKPA